MSLSRSKGGNRPIPRCALVALTRRPRRGPRPDKRGEDQDALGLTTTQRGAGMAPWELSKDDRRAIEMMTSDLLQGSLRPLPTGCMALEWKLRTRGYGGPGTSLLGETATPREGAPKEAPAGDGCVGESEEEGRAPWAKQLLSSSGKRHRNDEDEDEMRLASPAGGQHRDGEPVASPHKLSKSGSGAFSSSGQLGVLATKWYYGHFLA